VHACVVCFLCMCACPFFVAAPEFNFPTTKVLVKSGYLQRAIPIETSQSLLSEAEGGASAQVHNDQWGLVLLLIELCDHTQTPPQVQSFPPFAVVNLLAGLIKPQLWEQGSSDISEGVLGGSNISLQGATVCVDPSRVLDMRCPCCCCCCVMLMQMLLPRRH
jgi:hypothetical protein